MLRFVNLRTKLSKACYEKIFTFAAYAFLFCYAADFASSLFAIISYFTLMLLKLVAAVNQIRKNLQ